jgi:hypothetical protein
MELGWCIGITIVTPGFLKTKMALRAYEYEVGQLICCYKKMSYIFKYKLNILIIK